MAKSHVNSRQEPQPLNSSVFLFLDLLFGCLSVLFCAGPSTFTTKLDAL